LDVVELVLDPATGELPHAARMTGTQLSTSTAWAALRRRGERSDRGLAPEHVSGAL
jgi:hypothetical protein